MRRIFAAALATASALSIGAALAQGTAPGSQSTRAGKPANLCDELLAFVHPPAPAAAPGAAAAPAAPPPPKPTAAQIEKVETAQRDHNLQGCRDTAREMRKAGIVMPPPLLALAALDLKFFDADQKQ